MKHIRIFIGYITVTMIALLMTLIPYLHHIDLKILDTQFEILRKVAPIAIEKDVVVIGFDEKTYQSIQEPFALWHSHFAAAFKSLAIARPAVVGLDVSLPDRSFNHIMSGVDQELMKGLLGLRKASPIVLGASIQSNQQTRYIYPPFVAAAGNSVGYTLWRRDQDQVIRTYYPDLGNESNSFPTLVAVMAKHLGIDTQAGIINYALGEPFKYIPMQYVIELGKLEDRQTLKSLFHNKAVLFGQILPFENRYYQPVNLSAWEDSNGNYLPGVLVHAQTLRSIINSGLITAVNPIIFYAILISITCLWWVKSAAKRSILVFTLLLTIGIVGQLYLLYTGKFLPISVMLITGFIVLIGRYCFDLTQSLQKLKF